MNSQGNASTDVPGPLISKLQIEELFYIYTYELTTAETPGPESGRLMLLYGNNGAGKTTILNLIFHLLHPEPYGGHRSYLGKIPFRSVRVHLEKGIIVESFRQGRTEPGPYEIKVTNSEGTVNVRWAWHPEKTKKDQLEERHYREFCEILENLGITFHYLRDTRRVEGMARRGERGGHGEVRRLADGRRAYIVHDEEDEMSLSADRQLGKTINRAIAWFRKQALSGTNVGYISVNSIYRDIIKKIVTFGPTQEKTDVDAIQTLTDQLTKLRDHNSQFARFGLTPDLDIDEIIESLSIAGPQHAHLLKTVLSPYLDGHQARLNALQNLQKVMGSFISLLAGFYSQKNVTVHLEHGLNITAATGQDLLPAQLSSGEKQLLLLFCNAISARQDRTILMIDEPEISLNVRWQRQLIPALLTCMEGTVFQIILATHSVELLSQYRDYVMPLENLYEKK